jgi:hypothetical protein
LIYVLSFRNSIHDIERGPGVTCYGHGTVDLDGNNIYRTDDGVSVQGSGSRCVCLQNTIEAVRGHALCASQGSYLYAEANTINFPGAYGIYGYSEGTEAKTKHNVITQMNGHAYDHICFMPEMSSEVRIMQHCSSFCLICSLTTLTTNYQMRSSPDSQSMMLARL